MTAAGHAGKPKIPKLPRTWLAPLRCLPTFLSWGKGIDCWSSYSAGRMRFDMSAQNDASCCRQIAHELGAGSWRPTILVHRPAEQCPERGWENSTIWGKAVTLDRTAGAYAHSENGKRAGLGYKWRQNLGSFTDQNQHCLNERRACEGVQLSESLLVSTTLTAKKMERLDRLHRRCIWLKRRIANHRGTRASIGRSFPPLSGQSISACGPANCSR